VLAAGEPVAFGVRAGLVGNGDLGGRLGLLQPRRRPTAASGMVAQAGRWANS
jgi:hypothetical protein